MKDLKNGLVHIYGDRLKAVYLYGSCARDFVIPALNVYQLLPDTGTAQVNIPSQPAGTKLFFTCSMGMYTGQIVFQ